MLTSKIFILIVACKNCRRTSAVALGVETYKKETQARWRCLRCRARHQWRIPRDRTITETAAKSLRYSIAYKKARKRSSVYTRWHGKDEPERRKILFGELIWWWRNEADIDIASAAKTANITPRHWMRIEAGKSAPRAYNLRRVVHAVRGIMNQAGLVVGASENWKQDFIQSVKHFREGLSAEEHFQVNPRRIRINEPDVEIALEAFRNVLPVEPDETIFGVFANAIHQIYWGRLLGGAITMDTDEEETLPAVVNVVNLFERCEDRRAKYSIVYQMARVASTLMRKEEIADFAQHFLRTCFLSMMGEDETHRRVGAEWKQLTSPEKLVLALFDLIDPKYQPRLLKACRKLSLIERRPEWWFIPGK